MVPQNPIWRKLSFVPFFIDRSRRGLQLPALGIKVLAIILRPNPEDTHPVADSGVAELQVLGWEAGTIGSL